MNWLLAVNLMILSVITGGFVAGFLFMRGIYREIAEFLSSPGGDVPSPLSAVIDSVAQTIAAHIAVQVKTTLMGMLSGQSRQDSAESEIEMAVDNPMLAGIVDMLPRKIQKKIYKNPAIAKMVLDKVLGSKAGAGSSAPIASGNGSKAKFNL